MALDSCTRLEIHEIAAKLTDILYQRSNSGSFLSSFYTLQFICSAEGQTILQSKLRCLQEFHMNREILISSQKIHTRLLDSKESKQKRDWRLDNCEILKTEADQFDFGSSRKCGETAGYFVCKSFAVQFLQLYPESFENCHVCIDLETFQSDQEAEEFEYSDFPTGNLSALTKFEDANFSAAQTILQLSEVRTEKPGNRETIQERTIDLFFNTSNIDLASYRLTVILFLVLCIMA